MDEGQEQIRQNIQKLVADYNNLLKSKGRDGLEALSEANVRADFIDPLFEILGWNTRNPDEYDREHYVRRVGLADVALKLDGAPVVFVEAKRFGGIPHIYDRGDADWTLEERQVILYAASSKCKWAALTNFEKFRVFNALTGLTILDFESVYDYIDRFGELLYLTRHSVETGRIERLAAREVKPDIDPEFLNLLNNWRIELANDIYQRNKDNDVLKDEKGQLDLEKLKGAVQRILDRLIIIRWAEDNLVLEDPNILQGKYDTWRSAPTYNSIVDSLFADRAFFDKFDEIHDGKIFKRGHICERVKISDDVLGKIIHEMNQRSFRKFDFDILGNTYETYLGNTLYLKDDGTLGLKPSMETRKEAGIYYTPPYVVDYIVKNTLGELLKDKTPEDVKKIKVLDPACGSGSFLIKAFDYLKDYYEKENERIRKWKEKLIKEYMEFSGHQLSLDVDALEFKEHKGFEQKILRNNIHGVDLDRQAAEIASVNLMLKALKPKEKLPLILDENIKVGNSLISGTEDKLRKYFSDNWEKKRPFNWEGEFQDVFVQGGFDVVMGNPPWVSFGLRAVGKLPKDMDRYLRETYPSSAEYKLSVYAVFINRAIELLKEGGVFGFIVPDSFLLGRYFSKLRRYILDVAKIEEIMLFSEDFWPHGNVGRSVIIILQKEPNEALRKNNEVTVTLCSTLEDLGKKKFKRYSYKQDYFERVLYNRFRLFFDKQSKDFVDKREEGALKLNEIVSIHTGVRSKIGQKNIYAKEKRGATWKKGLISGSEIGKYSLTYDGYFLNIEPKLLWSGGWDPDVVLHDKLIMRQTGDSIYAMFDDNKYYHLNNCHSIAPKNPDYDLKYVLAILNSKLMNHYYHLISLELGRAMAQTDIETIEQLPIKPASPKIQQQFIALADKMLELNKELSKVNTDFDHYVNLRPRIKDMQLKDYIDKLPVSDKEVLRDYYGHPFNSIVGKIKEFEVLEEGEWLVFKIGYSFKTHRGKEQSLRNIPAFKFRIVDEDLRKFLYYAIKEYTTPSKLGKGNIYEGLLKIKIPQFTHNVEKNKHIIDEIMIPFLEEVAKLEKLEKEIEETDKTIDQKVCELYGLKEDEIKIVGEYPLND